MSKDPKYCYLCVMTLPGGWGRFEIFRREKVLTKSQFLELEEYLRTVKNLPPQAFITNLILLNNE